MENMLLDISAMLNNPTIMLDPPTPKPQTIKMEDLVTTSSTPPSLMTLPDTLEVPGTSSETTTTDPATTDPAKPPPKKRKVSASVIKSSS